MSVVTTTALSDTELRTALEDAHLPSLLPALALLTGDPDAQAPFRPAKYRVVDEQGGMTAEQQADARAYALDVLRRFRDGELGDVRTDEASVLAALHPLLGPDFPDYHPMALEELAISDPDPRGPRWRAPARPASDTLDVLVVGAGMSGLLAAHRLAQAGVRFTVLEKNADVGGTWFENAYPGCRVDVPSHLYSYSCLDDLDWASTYATRDEVLRGFQRFAEDRRLLEHVQFGHEVLATTFDERSLTWQVEVRTADGASRTLATKVLVSAVGQLNRPSTPVIPGQDVFAGRQFHSAAWDHDAPLAGKRYAVVGTGASAIQVVTGLLDSGAQVTVFQRSPAWLFPSADLRQPMPEGLRRLLKHVPTYVRWYRLWLQRAVSDGLLPFAECDPSWDDPRSISAVNDAVRKALTAYLHEQFGERPDLLEQLMPTYPPFAKRVIRDDGSYARAFVHDGARLVTAGIERLTEAGIVTADGEEHPLDGVVYATGFEASRFLTPMRVTGRGGRDLHEHWGPDATAHLGITVPGFPNLALLYGPNTNIVVNGSAIFFSECQVTYLLEYVRTVVEAGGALDVRPEVHDAFVAEIDDLNGRRAWGCAGVDNWYLSTTGRVSQNWPGTTLDYWQRTRALDPADFHHLPEPGRNLHA